jgi:hypothetical protein
MEDQAHPVSVLIAEFQELHNELRLEVSKRDGESLNWIPCSGANSVATNRYAHPRFSGGNFERSPEYPRTEIEMASSKWAVRAKRTYLT